MIRWAEHVALMTEIRNANNILLGKSEGKRSLGRPRRRWENNIKIDLRKIGFEVWIGFIWLRTGPVSGSCEHGNYPSIFIKMREISWPAE
jgi:hypothetical protein